MKHPLTMLDYSFFLVIDLETGRF